MFFVQRGFSPGVPASSHSPKIHMLTGQSKLSVGVNVNAFGCLFLCVVVSWERPQPPCNPTEYNTVIDNGWMDVKMVLHEAYCTFRLLLIPKLF